MVLAVLAVWLAVPGPSSAQVTAATVPPNAHGDGMGRGWECDEGFRKVDGACVGVSVPENAFMTNVSYGRGWECLRGYMEKGETCVAVVIPPHAFLSAYGDTWNCERTYRRQGEGCVEIKVPKNGYLTNASHGAGWTQARARRQGGCDPASSRFSCRRRCIQDCRSTALLPTLSCQVPEGARP